MPTTEVLTTDEPSSTAPIRRLIVRVTIGSFSLAALLGIVALLSGGFGETQDSVLGTTLLVGLVSSAVLCYLATAGRPSQPAGVAGGAAVLVPLISGLIMIWTDWEEEGSDNLLKVFGTGAVVAATLAQACLLLALGERARPAVRRLLAGTLVLAAVLAVLTCGLILGLDADSDGYWRLMGVVAILDVLGTVVVVASLKFGNGELAPSDLAPVAATGSGATEVRLPADLAAAVARLAATSGRSSEEVVAEAVRRYVDETC